MTARLPFTLTPHEGQDFVAWLHAYAARLDVTAAVLAGAIGLADTPASPERTDAVATWRTHVRNDRCGDRPQRCCHRGDALLRPTGDRD